MSNSVASSVNQKLSEYEIMQMVFSDLRSNRPKSFDVHDFNGLPVHRRYNICLPNMAVWKSMPNLPSVDDIQKPSEIDVLPSFPVHERAVSCPNMALLKNAAEALVTGCQLPVYAKFNFAGCQRGYPGKWTNTFGQRRFPQFAGAL